MYITQPKILILMVFSFHFGLSSAVSNSYVFFMTNILDLLYLFFGLMLRYIPLISIEPIIVKESRSTIFQCQNILYNTTKQVLTVRFNLNISIE